MTFRACVTREVRHVTLLGTTGTIRTATFEDREHVVVPVVALMEGVIWPVNAETPEFVAAEELAKAPSGWNGRPVLPDHPSDEAGSRISANDPLVLERFCFGRVFHTAAPERVLQTKKLEMEAWLDPARAGVVGPDAVAVIERCRAGEVVEVSVGAFVIAEQELGEHKGQRYTVRWAGIVPDHLALLPNGAKGACSVEMGCGAPRAARRVHLVTADGLVLPPKEFTPMKEKPSLRERVKALIDKWNQSHALTEAEGMSDAELRSAIDAALRASEPGYLGIEAVFPDDHLVVFAALPGESLQFFRRSFSVAESGEVSLKDAREEVRPVTNFEPLTTASAGAPPCGCHRGDEAMHPKAARVKALIDNPQTTFTAADQAGLELLSEAALATLEASAASPREPLRPERREEPPPTSPPPTRDDPPKDPKDTKDEPKEKTPEELEKMLPADVQAMIARGRAAETSHRTDLVTKLKAAQSAYTEDELKAMATPALEKLAAVAKVDAPAPVAADFSGRGVPRAAREDDAVPESTGILGAIKAAREKKQPAA